MKDKDGQAEMLALCGLLVLWRRDKPGAMSLSLAESDDLQLSSISGPRR